MERRKIKITKHARKRLHERVEDPHNDAYRRLVRYAWKNGQTIDQLKKKNPMMAKLITRHVCCGRSKVWKLYRDHVYVFACDRRGERVLVTVMSVEEMVKKMMEEKYRIREVIKLDWGLWLVIYQDAATGINSVRLMQDVTLENDKMTFESKRRFFSEKDLNYEESDTCVTVSFYLDEDEDMALQEFCDKHEISQYALTVALSKFLCNPDNHDCIVAAMEDIALQMDSEIAV